ncbi:phosphatidate cytidylyltransferase [Streptomyces cellulosae]|uniref:phosphatidate cytidylyltransferase n=1 Tax=Streptomyces cellulosae TaxID=1968 RepID=UPI00069054BB|nr:phosphatidate cytidylyltransferase [Streptomyces cellulosae]
MVTGAFWLGRPSTAGIALSVGVIAAVEFGGLMRLCWVDRVVLAVAVAGVVLATWLAPGQMLRVVPIGALALAAVPLLAGDDSHWLPGSGGLLDRIDSLLIALAVMLVLR